ncbi:hypothetical protein ACF0H5_007947 [Mactra antiquata]
MLFIVKMSGQNTDSHGYDIVPSHMEQTCHPPTEETITNQRSSSYISTHHANISEMYNSKNPLVTGLESNFNTNVSLYPRNQGSGNQDIVPELIHAYDGYKKEIVRLETFYDWPLNAPVKKEDLARNGFIYTHITDRCQCVFCRGILSSWEEGDVVELEHKKHCPECPFAFGYECDNVPLNLPANPPKPIPASTSSTSLLYLPISNSQSVTPSYQSGTPSYNTTVKVPVESRYNISNVRGESDVHRMDVHNRVDSTPSGLSSMENSIMPALPSLHQGQSMEQSTTATPKYRDWGDEYKRIRSFRGWPTQMTQTPIELAKAGLLYMGKGDRCKCFWCGGELYDWELQDEPWEEHAKWFPHCGYVRAMKGDNFVKYVRDKQNGLVVDPPVQELMKTPHVLAVLNHGYTQEQVQEVFNRFGRGNLVSAPDIIKAIEDTKRQRQAILRETSTTTAGTQETRGPIMPEPMDVEPNTELKESIKDDKKSIPQSTLRPSSASSTNDVEKVMLENEKLKDMKLCKICMDNELCMTFLPCGHLATCEGCSTTLTECPICRNEITQRVKVFWA